MRTSISCAFISILAVTESTLANSFPDGPAKVFASSPTEIVTTGNWQTTTSQPATGEANATTAKPVEVSPPASTMPVQTQTTLAQPPTAPVQPQPAPSTQVGPQIPQITVDLAAQKAYIWYVGMAKPIEVKVSTGGTLKKPDGNDRLQDGTLNPMQIYCGHWETRRARGGVVAVPFTGPADAEDKRDEKYTTYRNYVSGAFDNGDGTGGINMPYAIRVPREIQEQITDVIEDKSTKPPTTIDCSKLSGNRRCAPPAGIFIHERPGTKYAKDHMGEPVSGGCIRLPRQEDMPDIPGLGKIAPAKLLWEQTNKYRGINIEIINQPPADVEKRCNQRMVDAARDEVNATRIARDRDFGRKFYCYWNPDACRKEDILAAAQKREAARAARLAAEKAEQTAGRQ